jgi:RND family efflux transporter MFP subunit
MKKKTKKVLYLWQIMLMTVCLMACSQKKEQEQTVPLKVKTESAVYQPNEAETAYVGTVEEATSVAVSFTGMGTIKQVHVGEGQRVRKGQLIAEIDKTQAQNALATAQAMHKQATDAYNRMKQLHENKSLADIKWVEVQSKVEQAEASLAAAKKMLEDCEIHAPMDGIVGKKWVSAGETALPSQPVLTILDIKTLKVKVSIPEKEISTIKHNTSSFISIEAIGDKTLEGGKIEKGVVADALTHTYDIRIALPNPDAEILPGMVAKVYLHAGDSIQGMYLPVRSIQQSADGKHFVWVVKGGKAHRKDITMGKTMGNRIEVISGLDKDDHVITNGYQKVSEGTEVE